MNIETRDKIRESMMEGRRSGRIKSPCIKEASHPNIIDPRDFREERTLNRLTLKEIAEKYNCSLSYIKRMSQRYNRFLESNDKK